MGRLLAGLVPELSLLVSERNGIDGKQPTKRQGILGCTLLVMVLIAHVILQAQLLSSMPLLRQMPPRSWPQPRLPILRA